MNQNFWSRVLPFTVFMAFVGIEELMRHLHGQQLILLDTKILYPLYALKIFSVAAILIFYRKFYSEIDIRQWLQIKTSALSILIGLLIFALWIHLDWSLLSQGESAGFDPQTISEEANRYAFIACRLAGAVVVVPIMEELFWRSFLLRYLIKSQFTTVAIGTFSWFSFLVASVLFGLEHHYIVAGIVAGALFNLLLYQTRSIAQCILAHAVANLALGLYVLQTGQWRFW
ncbi:CAAX prenyl protease-related protein [Desulfuromonas sp. AOP6]|uniref:CAAX prenyl protease-related protein n=1 Tax=Desulfuromonas sp. AOP6 TaxID=1566351 RepID=UPI001281DF90|nr:CAAX prenyl protease-related protein [Desulfuromonas sp. AOP6]BCA79510.1 CAAX prenyl protease-related protein [Desulfuromonas sp. AOP6]